MHIGQFNNSATQRQIGIVRPRLYEKKEVAEQLNISLTEVNRLISEYKIKPTFDKRPYKYALHWFQSAINKKSNKEVFKVEKGIPIPPRRAPDHLNQCVQAVMRLKDGESTLIPEANVAYTCAKIRKFGAQVTTRNMRDGTFRVWMLKNIEA